MEPLAVSRGEESAVGDTGEEFFAEIVDDLRLIHLPEVMVVGDQHLAADGSGKFRLGGDLGSFGGALNDGNVRLQRLADIALLYSGVIAPKQNFGVDGEEGWMLRDKIYRCFLMAQP